MMANRMYSNLNKRPPNGPVHAGNAAAANSIFGQFAAAAAKHNTAHPLSSAAGKN